ncbi:hypothetical protein ACFPVX_18010 [Cohnella faecalis]|uniref:YqbQ/XkdQ domain-containing protein n=1 Tax=Cohnella faecalis TaxID=2315694 RepID=A0A398CN11_9BACL|nr:hypothetical protein [Cohnella faecalis]RIE01297.1 hypothetical protein D3H35_23215 [Cohnella faecalis]
MAFEVLLDNKDGKVWDISEIISSLEWTTSRVGKPGSLDFTIVDNLINKSNFKINNGDIIRVKKDGKGVFYGYVFKLTFGESSEVKVKAYDQIRYLLYSDSYIFTGKTATEIIRKIATDFKLKVGNLADTKYKIPKVSEKDKALLDIICGALDQTSLNGQEEFFLFDNFGALELKNITETLEDYYIGDESLMTGYEYSQSIDDDTYNTFRIVRDNSQTGVREVFPAQDSVNVAKWGRLQFYRSVDEKTNDAQIKKLLSMLAALKNRETRTLKMDAIGDLRLRAGHFIYVRNDRLGIKQKMLIDECSHKFDGDHTMSLEMKVI